MLRFKFLAIARMYTCQIKEVAFVNNRRKAAFKYGVAGAVIFVVLVTALLSSLLIDEGINLLNQGQMRFPTDLKYIFILTSDNSKVEYSPGQISFMKHQCPVFNCYISYQKTLLRNDMRIFDAVVFNIQEVVKHRSVPLNLKRSPHQLYILNSLEAANGIPICNSAFDNFFNLTWTYKLTSDIPHPFFNIHNQNRQVMGPKINTPWLSNLKHNPNYMRIIDTKRKTIAWIVTECQSALKHRKFINEFKEELAKYNYTLDIYGKCGYKDCTGKSRFKCYDMIQENYFFILVTEDSPSEDWMTEGIVNTLNHIAVPVVIGRANYSSFLPPGSYVDDKSFTTTELGAVINYFIPNPDKYSYFFDWRDHYSFTPRSRSYLCDLCAVINQKITKTYKDIRNWWKPDV